MTTGSCQDARVRDTASNLLQVNLIALSLTLSSNFN